MTSSPSLPPHLGLLLVLPDAIRQGLIGSIGGYLEHKGFLPVGAAPQIISPQQVKAIYSHGPTAKTSASGRKHGMTMTRRLMALDNSLAVLVKLAHVPVASDASRLLHDLKGPSSYLQRRAGSLRDLSGLADRCMSLIHTPDDAAQAAHHYAIFFEGVDLACVSADRAGRQLDWRVVEAIRGWHGYGPSDSRYAIAVRVILRCCATWLAWPGGDDPAAADAVWLVYDHCLKWLGMPPEVDTAREHERFLALCESVRPRVRIIAFRAADQPLGAHLPDLLTALTCPLSYDHLVGLEVLRYMESMGFVLTDFESHLLLTLITFFPD